MLAATVAGSEPPITKPKKRGPAVASVAGEPDLVEQRQHLLGGESAFGEAAARGARVPSSASGVGAPSAA